MGSNNKKVYVAMSGGVDSSVAALLLQKEGYDLTGVFMRNWHSDIHDGFMGDCPWEDDWTDVEAVCKRLDIPCKIWDFSKEYYDDVVSYFFREYEAGRTPNPDVMCNRYIKFGRFLDKAKSEGADLIATGHYVRKLKDQSSKIKTNSKSKAQNQKNYALLKGLDPRKDQSYFLWTLTQDQLQYSLFPIGEYEKSKVRAMAKEAGLPTYDKKDSQGICFIGQINVQEFLRSRLPEKIGKIVTTEGKEVGEHKGAYFYTQGQRHGLDVGGTVLPYYVQDKDVKTNIVTVVEGDEHPDLFKQELTASEISWMTTRELEFPFKCQAKIRYGQKVQDCTIEKVKDGVRVIFDEPQRAVSPGQSIVFYLEDECLGGGIID